MRHFYWHVNCFLNGSKKWVAILAAVWFAFMLTPNLLLCQKRHSVIIWNHRAFHYLLIWNRNGLSVCECVLQIDLGHIQQLRALPEQQFSFSPCIFINFISKVRSPSRLGWAGFNLICVACAIAVLWCMQWALCGHLICSNCTKQQQQSTMADWLAGWPPTHHCITGLHAHQIACALIFILFVSAKFIAHLCISAYARTRRWMNVMNNGWKKKQNKIYSWSSVFTTGNNAVEKIKKNWAREFVALFSLFLRFNIMCPDAAIFLCFFCSLLSVPLLFFCCCCQCAVWWFSINLCLGIDATMVFRCFVFVQAKQKQQTNTN